MTASEDILQRLAVVFEKITGLAQEGEAYLSELRVATMPMLASTSTLTVRPTVLLVDDESLKSLDSL